MQSPGAPQGDSEERSPLRPTKPTGQPTGDTVSRPSERWRTSQGRGELPTFGNWTPIFCLLGLFSPMGC